jgi:thiol-disulfide isomerase/thioredoxin
MRFFLWTAACGLFVAMVAGCVQSVQTSSPPPTSTSAAALAPADIKLVKADEKALEAMIAAHKGEVVFVDYWATWCPSCVEYFPHTVELHKKFNTQGLNTIAVTFDSSDDEPKAREFLAKQGADFENLLSSYDPGSAAFEAFGVELVPHFRLYDRQGKLRHKWDAEPKDAEQRIQELLAEKAS